MARYIDADKMVLKDNAYTTFPHDLAGCDDNDLVRWINEQPTADVAPKSEVEYLKEHLEMWCNKHKKEREEIERLEDKIAQYQIDLHYLVCRENEARERVATEIFDELEYSSVDGVISINSGYYAELKKKYTGETEPQGGEKV